MSILDKMQSQMPQSNELISSHFIKQWLHDTDCFLGIHDRKLCVLGLCTLITLDHPRPPVLSELCSRIMPALILLFDGLKRAYAARAQEIEEESDEEDDDDCEEAISSDEDDIDPLGANYFTRVAEFAQVKGAELGYDIKATIKVSICFILKIFVVFS